MEVLMTKMDNEIFQIKNMIYLLRDHKVMIDSDLATLYGVDTKRLNEQVKRNIKRFPCDFMFQLNAEEYLSLKSQIATSKIGRGGKQKLPLAFSENGVAMLSGILNSDRAIQVNISIMRIFTKLRSFHALETNLADEFKDFKENSNKLFKVVFERLDSIEEDLTPKLPAQRKKIGIKADK